MNIAMNARLGMAMAKTAGKVSRAKTANVHALDQDYVSRFPPSLMEGP